MKHQNLNNILRIVYFIVPIIVFIFLFNPVLKIKTTVKSKLGGETITSVATQDVSGFGLIGGLFVSKDYKGGNDTLKTLSQVKAIDDEEYVKGGRTIVFNGLFSLALLCTTLTLVATNILSILDFKNSKFNKIKNFTKEYKFIGEYLFGFFALMMFIFSFILSTIRYKVNIADTELSYKTCSYISFTGVLIFLLSVGYVVSKIVLTKKKLLFADDESNEPKQTQLEIMQ